MPEILKPAAARILHSLTTRCRTAAHVDQFITQLLCNNLRANTTVAAAFITLCRCLNLLSSVAFPLFINNHNRPHTYVCNTLLQAFAHSDASHKSVVIYSHMHRNGIRANNYTFPAVLKAAADSKLVKEGESVHAQVIKLGFMSDSFVGNSLLNLYAARGDTTLTLEMFDELPVRDVVSWTVVISGFNDSGRFSDALLALEMMRSEGVMPNEVTAVNALTACAGLGALEMGIWIHGYVRKNNWELDVILGTSLIEMYAKCGRMEEGLRVFEEMSEKNVFTWNAVIRGLALSENADKALRWFSRMESEGIEPDGVTLTVVLSACVHIGNVDAGRSIYSSLVYGKYGIPPTVEHCNCMVDLLARANYLDEAFRLIDEMPFVPTTSTWGALVAACRAHGAFELAEIAAWKLVELQPRNGAYYALLSNIYAENGRWDDVEKVRELMAEIGLTKDLGSSTLENHDHDLELVA